MKNWFYNLGLSKKLTATLMIVLSFTLITGIFSINRIGRFDGAITEMSEKWIPKSEILSRMYADVSTLRNLEVRHLVSGAGDERSRIEKELSSVLESIEKSANEYERKITRPEEKEQFEGFRKSWNAYLPLHARMLDLSRRGKAGEAFAVNREAGREAFEPVRSFIDKQMNVISAEIGKSKSESKRIYTSSLSVIIGLLVVSVVLGLWLTHFIVRRVTCRSLWWALKALETIAEGDLRQNINVKSTEEIGQLFGAMKKIIEKLREFSTHVNELTHSLARSSRELLATTEDMNHNAHQQAGQTDQVASAVVEMSQSFNDVASNAEEASRASQETSDAARGGFAIVEQVMGEMRNIVQSVEESSATIGKLGESSRTIGDIIATIEEVADQTNLLALNAAIEAARAGEHGRGFAVVADEVRALAERTGKATKEISAMIKAIQQDAVLAVSSMTTSRKEVDNGLAKAEEARMALEHIVEVSHRSMEMIQQIATATEEQSATTGQVSSNIELIASGTRTTEGAADQIQDSAKLLARLSDDLEQTATWFKVA